MSDVARRSYLSSNRHSQLLDTLLEPFAALGTQSLMEACVFHLAGLAHVGSCNRDPVRAFALNVTGTSERAGSLPPGRTATACFPFHGIGLRRTAHLPLKESDSVAPTSIYGATKLAAEALLQGYAATFPGFSCIAARLGNVYGQTAPVDSVVSILVQQAYHRRALTIRTLKPVRDFIHRDDVVEGLIRLAAGGRDAGWRLVNLSSGVPSSIGDVALAICQDCQSPPKVEETEHDSGDRGFGTTAFHGSAVSIYWLAPFPIAGRWIV